MKQIYFEEKNYEYKMSTCYLIKREKLKAKLYRHLLTLYTNYIVLSYPATRSTYNKQIRAMDTRILKKKTTLFCYFLTFLFLLSLVARRK